METILARKKIIKIRLTDAEMQLVDEAVSGIGIPLATWARYALLYGVRARIAVLLNENSDQEAPEIDF